MSNMNLLIHINAYQDSEGTNNPSLNNFKWQRDIQGITVHEPESRSLKLQSGQSVELFAGTVSLAQDATTEYSIALKSGTSNTYRIKHTGGTSPVFRTSRSEGHDATTEVSVSKNAKLLTFTSTGGQVFDLVSAGVQIGDEVRLGSVFNPNNQGKYKVLAFDATSFTVENSTGMAENNIVLGSDFAEQVNIFSADGVQVGSKIDLQDGFSIVSQGTYEVTDVSHDYVDFYSIESLPEETGITSATGAILIYTDAKQFVYIESNKSLDIKIDGVLTNKLSTFKAGTSQKPGVFMTQSSVKSLEITNTSQDMAEIFFVSAE